MIDGTYVPAGTTNDYGEFNMWGPLKEIILGTHLNLHLPRITPEFEAVYAEVMQPGILKILMEAEGRHWTESHPEYVAGLAEETELLKQACEAHGVAVHIERPALAEEINAVGRGSNGFTQTYAAEPLWVVGRNVLENVWSSDYQWAHLYPVREIHQPFIDADPNILHYTAPQPTVVPPRDYSFEGGDVLNLGDGRVVVSTATSSTNRRGAEWVKRMLEHDGYRVEIIELPDTGIHHLFAVICPAGPNLVIAYEDAFPNGLPEFMSDFDVIWTNREEALATAPCSTMLDSTHILVPAEAPRIAEELDKRGVTPIPVPFKHHAPLNGGIRCKISVVRRAIA